MDLDAIGVWLGATAGVVAALKLFTSFAPFQFVWKRLVHDPVQEGLRNVVRDEVSPLLEELKAEMQTNGGSTLRDAINRLEDGQHKMTAELADAKATAVAVRHELEASVLASQGRLVN